MCASQPVDLAAALMRSKLVTAESLNMQGSEEDACMMSAVYVDPQHFC